MKFNISKVKKIFVFILFILSISTCKNEVIDVMPYVQVSVTVSFVEILASLPIGSTLLKEGGYGGLIIYRSDIDQFVAFERLCTYYPNDTSSVVLDKSQATATCPKCKSSFFITDGSNFNGPAKLALRQYQWFYSNGRLTIVN